MKLFTLVGSSLLLASASFAQVVGGDTAQTGDYPWVVALKDGNEMICGASLIRSQWVLTAAHCAEGFPPFVPAPTEVRINLIDHNALEVNSEIIEIEGIFAHPDFDLFSGGGFDIALLKLKTEATSVPLDIATSTNGDQLTAAGTSAKVLGWGSTDANGTQSDSLKEADITVINKDTCIQMYAANNQVSVSQGDSVICAGYMAGEPAAGAGSGDSGGPLVVDQNGQWVQIGVVSGGGGTITTADGPGLYTDVSKYENWIDSVIQANSGDPTSVESSNRIPLNVKITVDAWQLHLQLQSWEPGAYQIQVLDALGREVFSQQTQTMATTIELSSLSKGLYVVSVFPEKNPGARVSRKFFH